MTERRIEQMSMQDMERLADVFVVKWRLGQSGRGTSIAAADKNQDLRDAILTVIADTALTMEGVITVDEWESPPP